MADEAGATSPSNLVGAGARDAFLSQIPSETTPGERSLLFEFFSRTWDGVGTIVEIGPFLGGTTRAIAWGMTNNPGRNENALLHTFDRFDEYYSAERLRETIDPLVRAGTFTGVQADELCQSANFERIFNAIHQPHSYSKLVRLHNSPLPDRPEEIDASTSLDVLAAESELGGVFIDGCKSWASTHYAMRFLLPRTRVGAPVIFQDFGWYTCFWITCAVHALREYIELESYVDATYLFRLKRGITAEQVAARIGRSPDEMGEIFFQEAATALFEASRQRGDIRGELIARLHHVAALATIGRKPAAAQILKQLELQRYKPFLYMITGCLKSPTYRPGNKPVHWNEVA